MRKYVTYDILKEACDICPWRSDLPPAPERFPFLERMKVCVEKGFNDVFVCARSPSYCKFACVGYLMSPESQNNAVVRYKLAGGDYDPTQLTSPGPLFTTYQEMAAHYGLKIEPATQPATLWRTYEEGPQVYTVRRVQRLHIPMSEWLKILADDLH